METVEKRQHAREEVFIAVMVSPNGDEHRAAVYDLSESGARVGLPANWTPNFGSALRLFFLLDKTNVIVLEGRVARVGIDHLGVQFAPSQEQSIHQLLAEVSGFS